jgi:hypothetical protein
VSPHDIAPMIMALALFFTVGGIVTLRGPVGRALARRIEGRVADDGPELASRIAELEDRVHQGELDRAQLEERLDFAERMLLQHRDPPKELPR